MEFVDVIPKIVSGFEIEKGKIVFLNFWGENKDLDILDKMAIQIAKVGGIPIKWQQSREFIKNYFSEVSGDHLNFPEKYYDIFKIADVVVDIFMYNPRPHKDFPKDKFEFYSEHLRKLFSTLTKDKQMFIQIRIPTEENARDEELDFRTYNDAMYNALNIDFNQLKDECTSLVGKLVNRNKVKIYSRDSNVLSFNLENRQWYKDDGTGDIPCGEIYIAPIEESAEGTILITEFILNGEKFSDILLEFNKGKLVKCSCNEVFEFVNGFKGDSDIIAEFGIGLNENVRKLIGCTVIDEKCKGTAHIAIGMNDMFGGKNSSNLHLDFIFQPIKIEIDDELFMNGPNIVI
ncbi:aminopeptidase [Inconstantimicrobium mannanitabidum]|uniref:Uncharacterized protein n=1 Tax=Inconstantimicrobium mannanitabidum TaxID=1604901 RepID=A0ACB5RHH9_9CLOT|nr:aminopeptidase [Clostridium sp. TW13]GKX68561.1 hypothetical protein rsdtw13_38190 [Clostridium sp. TW13]